VKGVHASPPPPLHQGRSGREISKGSGTDDEGGSNPWFVTHL
jgi:hypothetical protein